MSEIDVHGKLFQYGTYFWRQGAILCQRCQRGHYAAEKRHLEMQSLCMERVYDSGIFINLMNPKLCSIMYAGNKLGCSFLFITSNYKLYKKSFFSQ